MPKGQRNSAFVANSKTTFSERDLDMCKRFKQIRLAAKFTQTDFAALCRVSESKIKQVETGMQMPTFEMIRYIAKSLEVSYSYIIDGKRS